MTTNRNIIFAVIITIILLLTSGVSSSEVVFTTLEPISTGLKFPGDMAISPDGTIYVIDGSKNNVLIYNRESQLIGSISIQKPASIAVNSNGNIYIGTNDDLSVKILDSTHNIIGSLGNGAGEFKLPGGIAIDEATGNVYVVDQLDHSIKVYTSSGNFISEISDYPNLPRDVTIVSNEIYVIDHPLITDPDPRGSTIRGARVMVFDMTGNPIRSFGSYGAGEEQLIRPAGITSDTEGILYITDSFHGVVMCFDAYGSYLGAIHDSSNPMSTPMGIASGQDRRLFVASLYTSSIYIFGLEGYTNTEPSFTVNPSAGENGNINPSTPQTVNYNETTSFTVTPNTGYHIALVTGCGGTLSGNTYTTGPITGDCTVTATFAINTYIITASAGSNGSINPSGAVSVNYGADQSFSITPSANCGVTDVQVDGLSVGAVAGYTFSNVMANHTIVATFDKSDTTPPTGSITINSGATYTNTTSVTLNLSAYDPGGVSQMCISNTQSCLTWESYTSSKSWTLPPGDGTKTVYVWYQDVFDNADTEPYGASITLDTTAPVLTVSTLSDGSWTNNELLNVAGEVTDNTGILQLTINDEAVTINPDGSFSYPLELEDGPNTVNIRAIDLAGNEASDTRTINLDRTAPIIMIVTPADNMKTKQSQIDVTGTVDDQLTVTVTVNGSFPMPAVMDGNNFSLTVMLIYGMNTIEVTATDLAGNTAADKRTVTFDDQNPALSVTDPPQDVKTNQADMIIKGEAGDDLTAVTVTVTMDNNIYTPTVTSGQFEQPVAFTDEKTYQIYVKAEDEAGNENIVQRNIVYDITAPAVTIDPVTSPTNLNSQVLTGTMEAGATISVTCPTATVGTLTYPTATTWTVSLSNMQEGSNAITVTAADDAGNVSGNVTATIIVNNTYNLSVTKAGTGSGMVMSSPAGINCGSSCSAAYNNGTSVTLTASQNSDSFFAGWSGGGCSGTGTCKITMNADKAVTATFTQYIMVTVPNGGESWARGTTQTIKWTYAGNPGSYVKIELLKAGVLNRIITTKTSVGSKGAGSYLWKVPKSQVTGSDYKIKVTSTTNSTYTDTSNGNFTIK